jgi:hypothetical protein
MPHLAEDDPMTYYSPEFLAGMIQRGTIDHEISEFRAFIERVNAAEIAEDLSEGRITYAHAFGDYGVGLVQTPQGDHLEATAYASLDRWQGGPWRFEIGQRNAAIAYAKAALRNHLTAYVHEARDEAKSHLAELLAAKDAA